MNDELRAMKDDILGKVDRLKLCMLLDVCPKKILEDFIDILAQYENYQNKLKKDRERK